MIFQRWARHVHTHWELRFSIIEAGATLESPTMEFGETSAQILMENVQASFSHYKRMENSEQVQRRMEGRLLNGFWCFSAPPGLRYERARNGKGKVLVLDEPIASIIREALEGFASGRFQTQSEVKRFLDTQPEYPKAANGQVHLQRILPILTNPLYAGLIHYPTWRIKMRQGVHESLISVSDFNRILERLENNVYAPVRKDISDDFPLRGAVQCGSCGNPLSAGWSKGRNRDCAYYLCHNKDCPDHRKSIPKDEIETAFSR